MSPQGQHFTSPPVTQSSINPTSQTRVCTAIAVTQCLLTQSHWQTDLGQLRLPSRAHVQRSETNAQQHKVIQHRPLVFSQTTFDVGGGDSTQTATPRHAVALPTPFIRGSTQLVYMTRPHMHRTGPPTLIAIASPLQFHLFIARHVCIARSTPSQDVCPSVCLSVRPSHTGIVSTWLYISSKSFYHRVAPLL